MKLPRCFGWVLLLLLAGATMDAQARGPDTAEDGRAVSGLLLSSTIRIVAVCITMAAVFFALLYATAHQLTKLWRELCELRRQKADWLFHESPGKITADALQQESAALCQQFESALDEQAKHIKHWHKQVRRLQSKLSASQARCTEQSALLKDSEERVRLLSAELRDTHDHAAAVLEEAQAEAKASNEQVISLSKQLDDANLRLEGAKKQSTFTINRRVAAEVRLVEEAHRREQAVLTQKLAAQDALITALYADLERERSAANRAHKQQMNTAKENASWEAEVRRLESKLCQKKPHKSMDKANAPCPPKMPSTPDKGSEPLLVRVNSLREFLNSRDDKGLEEGLGSPVLRTSSMTATLPCPPQSPSTPDEGSEPPLVRVNSLRESFNLRDANGLGDGLGSPVLRSSSTSVPLAKGAGACAVTSGPLPADVPAPDQNVFLAQLRERALQTCWPGALAQTPEQSTRAVQMLEPSRVDRSDGHDPTGCVDMEIDDDPLVYFYNEADDRTAGSLRPLPSAGPPNSSRDGLWSGDGVWPFLCGEAGADGLDSQQLGEEATPVPSSFSEGLPMAPFAQGPVMAPYGQEPAIAFPPHEQGLPMALFAQGPAMAPYAQEPAIAYPPHEQGLPMAFFAQGPAMASYGQEPAMSSGVQDPWELFMGGEHSPSTPPSSNAPASPRCDPQPAMVPSRKRGETEDCYFTPRAASTSMQRKPKLKAVRKGGLQKQTRPAQPVNIEPEADVSEECEEGERNVRIRSHA